MLFAREKNCSLKSVRFVRDGTVMAVAIERRSYFGVPVFRCATFHTKSMTGISRYLGTFTKRV